MQKPDLDQIWQTWVRIASKKDFSVDEKKAVLIPDTIRNKIAIFPELLREGKIEWYCFLIHDYPEDPDNIYFHVRFAKAEGKKVALPEYCKKPERDKVGENISGIDKSLLENEDIREAWRIVGEQSDLIIKLVQIHKDKIPIQQFIQFKHYDTNMFGLGRRSRIRMTHTLEKGILTHKFLVF